MSRKQIVIIPVDDVEQAKEISVPSDLRITVVKSCGDHRGTNGDCYVVCPNAIAERIKEILATQDHTITEEKIGKTHVLLHIGMCSCKALTEINRRVHSNIVKPEHA